MSDYPHRRGIRQIDITFGDVVYRQARTALECGWNPDVMEVEENNRLAKIRECEHPRRSFGRNGWICEECGGYAPNPCQFDNGVFGLNGTSWRSKAYLVAEAVK